MLVKDPKSIKIRKDYEKAIIYFNTYNSSHF